ncbi:DNA recombination protein RmuC [Pedobacter aquatilis]|uniref:DNA recombination protein RmuC n=1 Tax=Pedobacter aquatilis TaxID=351343 RepID=UPI00292DAC35|nr:DNA recombination protein RmuC [Pedobacter aquatilis]
MELIIYAALGCLLGIFLGLLISKLRHQKSVQFEKDQGRDRFTTLEMEFVSYKSTAELRTITLENSLKERDAEIAALKDSDVSKEAILQGFRDQISIANANLTSASRTIEEKKESYEALVLAKENVDKSFHENQKLLATARAENDSLSNILKELNDFKTSLKFTQNQLSETESKLAVSEADSKSNLKRITDLESLNAELKEGQSTFLNVSEKLANSTAENKSLRENLEVQKTEIEALGKKFTLEFENIANKILDNKTEKFTKLNSDNLKNILEPLGQNITDFKKQVDEVYKAESKERFSLGERVKELSELNKVISEEANNLTKALKGESKTQGRWGEMILESILERSGLVKNREYFMEHELMDNDGRPLKSDSEGKKMRPDAVIKYPDNRNVIIDSKVSLNAFTRMIGASDVEVQKAELISHVAAIKSHISTLSLKGYDDYNKSLDFVMLFVPSEPAYIAAMQHDPDLWNFAYDKRILLLSPTNLITSLKLIVDLWKRDYQNQNAALIAARGAKLYDKFYHFVKNLEDVGNHLNKAHGKYGVAFNQLTIGPDNLVAQATKLKNLGLKTKHSLAESLVENAIIDNED